MSRWRSEAVRRLAALLGVPEDAPGVGDLSWAPDGDDAGEPQLVNVGTPDGAIPAWLLRPRPDRDRGVAVVALAGHGPGIDALVVGDPADGDFHGGVARKLAAAGFTVLCPELTSFGRRRTPEPDPRESSCQVDAMNGLLTGRPVLGRRVADARAALAAVRTLPGVDPDRVAVLGGSGGGAVSLLTAALDDDVPAAVVATYFGSFAASLGSVSHCICNAVPDLLTWFEMADIAALIAPRTLIIESGAHDPIFPIGAARAGHAELIGVWSAFDRPPPDLVFTPAGHQFVADDAIELLVRRLGAAPGSRGLSRADR